MRPILVALATAAATMVPLAGVSTRPSAGAEPAPTSAAKPAGPKAEKAVVVPGRYIVMTKGAPLAGYRGGVQGMPRTKPAAGQNINVRTTAAKQYRAFLLGKHRDVLAKAGLPTRVKVNDYSVAFNGFSAKLSAKQARTLAHTPGVVKVWPVEIARRHHDDPDVPGPLGPRACGARSSAATRTPAAA